MLATDLGLIRRLIVHSLCYLTSFFQSAMFAGLTMLLVSTMGHGTPVAGDVAPYGNPDGVLNAGDAVIMQRFAFGYLTPTPEELLAADIAPLGSPDGQINAADIALHLRAITGRIVLPPVPDTVSPNPVDTTLVVVGTPVGGVVTVVGATGSVEGDAVVRVINLSTGIQEIAAAASDGSFTVSIAALDGQVLSITVIDAADNASLSSSVSVGQVVDVSISSPIDGEVVGDSARLVAGMYSGPPGTAITVNGQVACLDGSHFYAENVPLLAGANIITVTAAIADGVSVTDSVSVTSTGAAQVQARVAPSCGIAPHSANFSVAVNAGVALQLIEFDFDGDGLFDISTSDQTAITDTVYTAPGVYQAVIRTTDDQGNQQTYTQQVIVNQFADADALLSGIYGDMLNRLRTGNLEGALKSVSPGIADKYREIFSVLKNDLPLIVDQLGVLQSGVVGDDMAEYVVVRQVGADYKAFMVYFSRGDDGVWRIDGM